MNDLKELFSLLIRYETELWDAIDARLRLEHDLPLTRFEPMQVIMRIDGCRVNDIAEAVSITIGGTSKMVDWIEQPGYCTRRPNPRDRRSSIIALTPAGEHVFAAATVTIEDELERRIGAVLSARALTGFASTLETLRRAGEDHAHEELDHAVRGLSRSHKNV